MSNKDLVNRYYDAFRTKTDFSEVPFDDTIVFRTPTGVIEGATQLRGVLAGLATTVKSVDVRHQLAEGDCVVSVYDFDMGAPGGPIAMAERLRIKAGQITEGELLFDSKLLGG